MSSMIRPLPYKPRHFPTKDAWFRYVMTEMQMLQGIMAIGGQPGAGKTTFIAAFCWWAKKLFNVRITSDFRFKPTFGDFTFFEHKQILEEKAKVDEIARKHAEWQTDDDSIFLKRIVVIEEAYKELHKRRGMSNIMKEIAELLKQWRHFQSMFILVCPDPHDLDAREIDPYVTLTVHSSFSLFRPNTSSYDINNKNNYLHTKFNIYGPSYWPLFDSFAPITMGHRIDSKEYKKIQKERELKEQLQGGN